MYSSKRGCIRAKMFVFVQSGGIRTKWLYLTESSCIGHCGCIRAGLLYRSKIVVFEKKWLYSVKNGIIPAKVVVLR